MATITIDGKTVEIEDNAPVIDAAAKAGIEIPTLCYLPGQEHVSSCMVCIVKDCKTGALMPACTAKVVDGMEIDTESDDVMEMRKSSLELMLSEHIGDCEAPCRITCQAGMDVPLMLREIQRGNFDDALKVVRDRLAMPAVLGYVCEAPCEKACRRGRQDATVQIMAEHRFLAEKDLNSGTPKRTEKAPSTNKKVAVIGAGLSGLTAAYFLATQGHSVTLFEHNSQAGGYLLTEEKLPADILKSEIDWILSHNIKLELKTQIDKNRLAEMTDSFDAVIIACADNKIQGDPISDSIFTIDIPSKYIQSAAGARECAELVHTYLISGSKDPISPRFNSRMGALKEGELLEFMKNATGAEQAVTVDADTAVSEAERCLHCDCRKQHSCKLRIYSEQYGADQKHFDLGERSDLTINTEHQELVFEPGKCITCGICTQLAEEAGEPLGLSYLGRGYDLTIAVPFDEAISNGVGVNLASTLIDNCPTAALAYKHREDKK